MSSQQAHGLALVSHQPCLHMQPGKLAAQQWNAQLHQTHVPVCEPPLLPQLHNNHFIATHRLHQNLYPQKHKMMMQFEKHYLRCLRFVKTMKSFGDALKQLPHQLPFPTRTWHPGWNIKWSRHGSPNWARTATSAFVECQQINACIQR